MITHDNPQSYKIVAIRTNNPLRPRFIVLVVALWLYIAILLFNHHRDYVIDAPFVKFLTSSMFADLSYDTQCAGIIYLNFFRTNICILTFLMLSLRKIAF